MPLPASLEGRLRLPLIAAPMFLVSGPELVSACCRAGIIGAFPSLNARPIEQLEEWLTELDRVTADTAPYAVNLIVHKSNGRLQQDLDLVIQHKVPVVITSVGHPGDIAETVHGYGGIVLHDVIHLHHARKAVDAGVDGIILVCAGAGGHAGLLSPFTLVPQLRAQYDGTIILSGALSDGRALKAARVLGADLGYMGTRFIATQEARADQDYRRMIVEAESTDIVYTNKVSGIWGNFLRDSLDASGIAYDIAGPQVKKDVNMDLAARDEGDAGAKKAWKEVWSAGQGVGQIHDVLPVAELVARLQAEYEHA